MQADSLPAEPPGKPKNTGVGSLFLLQGIFPTQESNWGLLHCRRILYQLSYQGNPYRMRREVLRTPPSTLVPPSVALGLGPAAPDVMVELWFCPLSAA